MRVCTVHEEGERGIVMLDWFVRRGVCVEAGRCAGARACLEEEPHAVTDGRLREHSVHG